MRANQGKQSWQDSTACIESMKNEPGQHQKHSQVTVDLWKDWAATKDKLQVELNGHRFDTQQLLNETHTCHS